MWIIGDIHGCARELNTLLEKIPEEDRLIFLGDYVDRGPDSRQVITRLIKEKKRSVFLMGNHEEMMLSYFLPADYGPSGAYWTLSQNGGKETMLSYGLTEDSKWEDLPANHRNFLENLVIYHEEKDFFCVHAGVRVDGSENLSEQNKNDLLWIRTEWINRESEWKGKHVFFGHTPTYMLGIVPEYKLIEGINSTGIDTGCVYGGYLTAIHAETREVIQVEFEEH